MPGYCQLICHLRNLCRNFAVLCPDKRVLPGYSYAKQCRHIGVWLIYAAGWMLICLDDAYSQSCTITTTNTDVLCHGEHNGSINISAEGGTEPYAFSWTGPGSFESSDEDLSGLEAGSYTVMVVGADSSCTGTATVTISQPDHPLEITVQPADQTDCYGNVVDFSVSVNGIVGTPSYQWQYMPPGGDFANIGGSSGLVLNVPDIGVSGQNVDGSQYRVIITDACMSITSDPALLSINAITNLTPAVVNSTICSGGSISYEVFTRGDVTGYQWSRLDGSNWVHISNGGAYSGANSSRLTISDATTEQTSSYRVSVTFNTLNQPEGYPTCVITSHTRNRNLTVLPALTPSAISADQSICYNSVPDALTGTAASGGSGSVYSYRWQRSTDGDSWVDISGAEGLSYSPSSLTESTYYRIAATDEGPLACGTVYSIPVIITVELLPEAHITVSGPTDICQGESVVLTSSEADSYLWSTGETTRSINVDESGSYSVTVSDACGNTATDTREVNVFSPVSVTCPALHELPACTPPADILTAYENWISGFSFTGGHNADSNISSIPGLPSDVQCTGASLSFEYIVPDECGEERCTSTFAVNGNEISGEVEVLNTECQGGSTGAIDLTVSGCGTSFTYLWSNGSTSDDIYGLSAGSYSVTITDSYHCTTTIDNIVVEESDDGMEISAEVTDLSCSDYEDGAIDLTVSGGASPYNFLWSNGSVTEDLENLDHGTYSVTVTDANGCHAEFIATIDDGPLPATPTFVQIGPVCLNSSAPELPSISNEGITGTWSPEEINTSATGITIYTFSPHEGQCATNSEMEIMTDDEIIPLFEQPGPLLRNTPPPDLPEISTNGITGTWDPAEISTETAGTFTYTFTPEDNQCSTIITMDIMIINASLEITKISEEDTFSAEGDQIHYDVTVTNIGTVMLTDITVSDSLTNLDETIESLDPGSSRTINTSYPVTWGDIDRGYIENRAFAYFIYEGEDYIEEAERRIDAVQGNSIIVNKVAAEDSFTAEGDRINFMIFVTNNGNVTLTDINVTDPLTGLDETIPSLAPNESVVFNTTYAVVQNDLIAGYVHNTARAIYQYRGEEFEESYSVTVNAVQNHDISVVKIASEDSFSAVGDEIHYTITIINEGNSMLNEVSVNDPLTGLYRNIPSIAPGESETIHTAYSVTQDDIDRGFVENSALASYNFDGEHYEEGAMEIVDARFNNSIIINKVAVTDSFSAVGDEINYMIFVTNNGNVTLANIILTDSLTDLTRIIPSLAPNEFVVFATTYTVIQDDVDTGRVNNVATARYSFGGEVFERTISVTVDAEQDHNIVIEKLAHENSFSAHGDEINFTITIINTGNETLTNIILIDPLTGLYAVIESLDPGVSIPFNTNYTATLNDINRGYVANEAMAYYDINGEAHEEVAVVIVDAVHYQGIFIDKAADIPEFSEEGDTIHYNISVMNPGNVTLTDLRVTDPLTGLDEIIVSLEPNQSQSYNVMYIVTLNDIDNAYIHNRAFVRYVFEDEEFEEGAETTVTAVIPAPPVIDESPPAAVCRNITIYLDLVTGWATIVAGDVDGGSYDNSGYIDRMIIDRNQFDCTNIGPNNVTLTVYDESNNSDWCVSVVTVLYAVDPLPAADPQFQVICDDSETSIDLTSNIPGATWTWTVNASPEISGASDDDSGTLSSISQVLHNSDLSAHYVIYNVIPRVYGECNLERITAEVWVNPEPEIRVSAGDDLICNLGSTVISVTNPHGAVRDQWMYDLVVEADPGVGGFTPSGTYTSPTNLTETLTNSNREISSVVYRFTPRIVTADGSTACTGAEQSITIQVYPTLTNYYVKVLSDYNGFNINCYGNSTGSIVINPTPDSPPMTYSWIGPEGFRSSDRDISGLIAGEYVLTVTDLVTMCSETDTVDLTQPPYPISMTLDLSQSTYGGYNINCYGASTGWIIVTPHNNIGLVDFMWVDGAIGHERTNLPAGPYKVIITDSKNCTAESSVTLTEPTQIVLHFDVVNSTCPGKPDGAVTVDPSGGVPEIPGDIYTYLWSNNSTSQSIENIVEGMYTVYVTDMNACTVTGTARVESMNEYCLIIPEAFSPNDDGTNDLWRIEDIELYPDVVITIYNRWSQEVWRSERGYTQPWDGRSNGTMLPVDSYHYVIELNNGIKPIVGHVTIVR